MKYFAVFMIALALGYAAYPLFNPDRVSSENEKMETHRSTNVTITTTNPAVPAEEIVKRPVDVQVDIQPERIVEIPTEKKTETERVIVKNMTLAERILADKIDMRTYLGFSKFPVITSQDSRLLKLNGKFTGKLKPLKASRTGILENITLEINQDPEKEMTKFEVIDIYDNIGLNVYQLTDQSFRSIPGDENLLMLRIPEGFIVLDIRSFPKINGKVFAQNKMTGEFSLGQAKPK